MNLSTTIGFGLGWVSGGISGVRREVEALKLEVIELRRANSRVMIHPPYIPPGSPEEKAMLAQDEHRRQSRECWTRVTATERDNWFRIVSPFLPSPKEWADYKAHGKIPNGGYHR